MTRTIFVCAISITFSLLAFGFASAEEEAAASGPFPDARGYGEYQQYCASCHGVKADGNGPMADDLKVHPADLRLLGVRFGNPLPRNRLSEFIDGRQRVRGHSSREMPVWGRQLHNQNRGGQAHEGHVRGSIMVIIEYLDRLQIQSGDEKAADG